MSLTVNAHFSTALDGFPPADVANGTLVAIVSKVANLCEVALGYYRQR